MTLTLLFQITTTNGGFPTVVVDGIDGCHIPIIGPNENHCDYYNIKGFYSVILQGVCNDRYRFTDIFVGWPGLVHDARVLQNSQIYVLGEDGRLFDGKTAEIGGQ